MNTREVAEKLVSFIKEGKYDEAHAELFTDNAISVEPEGMENRIAEGREAIKAKGEMWQSMVEEVHSMSVSEPLVADDHFSVQMAMNITYKGAPGPHESSEIAVFTVEDGKIVKEEFFYKPLPQEA